MADLRNKTDEELALLALREAEVFGEIIKRYKNKINRYIARLINQYAEAEDLTQETFIKAYENLASFNPKLKFSSWLFRIAHNLSVNFIKKNYKYKISSLEKNTYLSNILASQENILELIIKQESDEAVTTNLSRLALKYREPLQLYYLDGKSYLEIADILHISINSVGPTIIRAKVRLKKIMEDESNGRRQIRESYIK